MPERPRKAPLANPFYALLLVASTLFALTALAYTVSPLVQEQAIKNPKAAPNPASQALAKWIDRRGPMALGIELAAMAASGLLAMVTDRYFPGRRTPGAAK